MKSKIIWEDLDKEAVEQAENLGLPQPEPKKSEGEIYFDASYIHLAYLNSNGEIIAFFPSGNWVLEYDEQVWEEIKTQLDKNNGML